MQRLIEKYKKYDLEFDAYSGILTINKKIPVEIFLDIKLYIILFVKDKVKDIRVIGR